MGVLIGSAVMPITLAMFWGRMNSYGMMSGAIGGSVCSLSTWLIVASTLDGGLSLFLVNTGNYSTRHNKPPGPQCKFDVLKKKYISKTH